MMSPGEEPEPSKVMFLPVRAEYGPPAFATGAWLVGGSVIVAVVLLALLAPSSSTTVKVTLYVPADKYVWVGLMPVPVVLSPKSHS